MGPIFKPEDLAAPGADDDPTLTDDMCEIYFSSTRALGKLGPADIWRSTRSVATDPWGTPEKVEGLNDQNENVDDQNPGISGDGLKLWFSSNRGGNGNDIYFTERTMRGLPWSPPRRIVELSDPLLDDLGPEPERSLLRITLYKDGTRQLFEATRKSVDGPWSVPVPIESLNEMGNNNNLSGFFVTDLEFWFASDRPDVLSDKNIYRAVRPSIKKPFEKPELIEAVSSNSRDDDPWMSADRHTLFFTSSETGHQEIYFAVRP